MGMLERRNVIVGRARRDVPVNEAINDLLNDFGFGRTII